MGAHASSLRNFTLDQTEQAHLLDSYSLGKELGRGAYGTVYSCTSKESDTEYAVKRVNTVGRHRSGIASINKEICMLRKLAHPYVAKLQCVSYHFFYVDMVFDLYRGGDMVNAMEHHFESKGDIPILVVQNISMQMLRSIEWLHANKVVHRDVKPDNFLLDRLDLAHPECRVYLSDFGTAVELRQQRLQQPYGTELYWAPEVYQRSYAFKVDVWAAGVVMYSMVTRRFPFMDKHQVHAKRVKIPPRCGKAGENFLLAVLKRSETQRLSASEALDHTFLMSTGSASRATDPSRPSCERKPKRFGSDDCDNEGVTSLSTATTAASSGRSSRSSSQSVVAGWSGGWGCGL